MLKNLGYALMAFFPALELRQEVTVQQERARTECEDQGGVFEAQTPWISHCTFQLKE